MDSRLASDLASLRIDREHSRPSGRGARFAFIGAACAAVLGFVAWRTWAPVIESKLFKTRIEVTEVRLVFPAQPQVQLTATGYVVPQVQVDISSKIVGRIGKVQIHEGSTVNQGQVLFELDANDLRAKKAAAVARVDSSRARTVTARAQAAEVAQQVHRDKLLLAHEAIGQAEVDDLDARLHSLEAQVGAAQTDVGAAEAEAAALDADLANATIRAPIAGTVVTKPMQVGDVVTPGVSMARLVDMESLVVEADVPEARIHLVKKGQPCEIVLDAYPDRRWRGEVHEYSPELDRAKATATAKVHFLEHDDSLLPQMAARVSLLDAPLDERILNEPPRRVVPGSAVVDRSGKKVVFALDSGRARISNVVLGGSLGTGVELVEGPAAGTKLVSNPSPTLDDGQAVVEQGP